MQDIPDVLQPGNSLQHPLGDPKAFPGQMRSIIPSNVFWIYPGVSSPVWRALTAKGRHPDGLLTRSPNLLNWFLWTWRSRSSTLSSLLMFRSSTLSLRLNSRLPMEENNFRCLYPQPHSFGHCPKLVTMGKVRNVRRLTGEWKALVFTKGTLHQSAIHIIFHSCSPMLHGIQTNPATFSQGFFFTFPFAHCMR